MKLQTTFKITTINVILSIITFCIAGFIWNNDIPWVIRIWLIGASIWNGVIILKITNRGLKKDWAEIKRLQEELRQERAKEQKAKDDKEWFDRSRM